MKELVENAIDAGALRIGILVEMGGKKLIRVEDDGEGMATEEGRGRGRRAGRVSLRDARVAAELQFGLVESALRDCFLRAGGKRRGAYVQEVARALNAYQTS